MDKVLITGAAGFIGFHLTRRLLGENYQVIGIDELNDYYSVDLKKDRLAELGWRKGENNENFQFYQFSTYDRRAIEGLFEDNKFDFVIHLAAQAGVRHSIDNPYSYTLSNIEGFLPILEACRNHPPKHMIFASSSSVYGNSNKIPFDETDVVDKPVSLYAATKKANELMAYTYSHLYNIPITGLRFFTVYGPWGRPDMAYFKFAKAILDGKPIDVYNNGNLRRDFTYIDDVVDGICGLLKKPSGKEPPYNIFNIGNSIPVNLLEFINILEDKLGKKSIKSFKPMQAGDVYETYASVKKISDYINYQPRVNLETGLQRFANWFKDYY